MCLLAFIRHKAKDDLTYPCCYDGVMGSKHILLWEHDLCGPELLKLAAHTAVAVQPVSFNSKPP